MPGPYSKPKGVTITGGGGKRMSIQSQVYYNEKAGDLIPLPKKARRAAEVFAQQQAVDKMKFNAMVVKPLIKSWEDRNVRNRGSKLNPNIGYEKGSMTPEEAKYYSKVGY